MINVNMGRGGGVKNGGRGGGIDIARGYDSCDMDKK